MWEAIKYKGDWVAAYVVAEEVIAFIEVKDLERTHNLAATYDKLMNILNNEPF